MNTNLFFTSDTMFNLKSPTHSGWLLCLWRVGMSLSISQPNEVGSGWEFCNLILIQFDPCMPPILGWFCFAGLGGKSFSIFFSQPKKKKKKKRRKRKEKHLSSPTFHPSPFHPSVLFLLILFLTGRIYLF